MTKATCKRKSLFGFTVTKEVSIVSVETLQQVTGAEGWEFTPSTTNMEQRQQTGSKLDYRL